MRVKRPFLDTNILIYAVSTDRRSERALALLSEGAIICVQQLNEFAAVASRKLKMPWPAVEEKIDDILTFCPDPVPVTESLHRHALDLSKRFQYTIYGSLVLAAALERSCDVLYTEDMQNGQIVEGLLICNPFGRNLH